MAIIRTFTSLADRYVTTFNTSYTLHFMSGDDLLTARLGTVLAYMGGGNDYVRIESTLARIYGEGGADRFDVLGNSNYVNGGTGDDAISIRAGGGHSLYGLSGNDRFSFFANSSDIYLSGGDGNDVFVGNGFDIGGQISGGAGNDTFQGFTDPGSPSVTLYGRTGNDTYRVTSDASARIVEYAGEGIDSVFVARGLNYKLGSSIENLAVVESGGTSTASTLTGNGIDNRITGSSNHETISGLGGSDILSGGGGGDVIYGGFGNDLIVGGAGTDTLWGGAGADHFIFKALSDVPATVAWDSEWIADWHPEDRIDLSAIDANSELAGFQEFTSVLVAMGYPIHNAPAGTIVLGGFGGTLAVLVHTDGDHVADMVIGLWSDGGEAWLTPDNIII